MKKLFFSILFLVIFSTSISQPTVWYNPMESSVDLIAGRWWGGEIGSNYSRLPVRIKDSLRKPLWDLSQNSAGLSVSFMTNAPRITVRYTVEGSRSMYHMQMASVSGIDLYSTDCNGRQGWCKPTWPNFADTITYVFDQLEYSNNHNHGNQYRLYFPLYTTLTWLEIGVPQDAAFSFVKPTIEKPIVIYGTSITQGACASRPAMAWGAILERQMQTPVVNLGFSGQGQLDKPMFEMLAEIDAKLYLIDCLPNLIRKETAVVYDRTIEGVKLLRQKNNTPILLAEHSGYMNDVTSPEAYKAYNNSNLELKRAYDSLTKWGVENISYITKQEIGLSHDSQVDGVHPTDLGMQQYADAYTDKIRQILNQPIGKITTMQPVTQNRDADTYNWNELHEDALANKTTSPDIVMVGNSITHFWGDSVKRSVHRGFDVWQKLFEGRKVLNLGCGWDKIENVYWRLYHGEFDNYSAKQIFLMIGTNNLSSNSPSDIAQGIVSLARAIAQRQPTAQINVINILPRSDFDLKTIELINEMVNEKLTGSEIRTINIAKTMLDKKGAFNQKFFGDTVHPNMEGYQKMADELRKYFVK